MIPVVTLTIGNDELEAREFTFDQPLIGCIGRAKDCEVRLPDEPEFLLVSRHHCLLDIEPPEISVSDFGSLNGTFVNGARINGEERTVNVTIPLKDGDELRVGNIAFRVGVVALAFCAKCGAQLGASEIAFPDDDGDEQRCAACRKKVAQREMLSEVY